MRFPVLQTLVLLIFHTVRVYAFNINSKSNVAVYWGQNSAGSQQRLSYYCDSSSVDIIILSFLDGFPTLDLNFANQCDDTFSDGLLHCSEIGQDITTCQSNGKKVLLSLGGASGSYGFTSDSQAEEFASTLWSKFGGGSDNERPFDSAIVDGFDFDIENNNQIGYVALANKLRDYFNEDTSKTYYLSAAPQCVYPDASVGDLLSQVYIDFAFIQFYNNYCELHSNFNWDTWEGFTNTAPNTNIKLFLGLPASSSSASSGYSTIDEVTSAISIIGCDSSFGGIVLWDASSAWSNVNNEETYAVAMKKILNQDLCSTVESDTAVSTAIFKATDITSMQFQTSSIFKTTSVLEAENKNIITTPSTSTTSLSTPTNTVINSISNLKWYTVTTLFTRYITV